MLSLYILLMCKYTVHTVLVQDFLPQTITLLEYASPSNRYFDCGGLHYAEGSGQQFEKTDLECAHRAKELHNHLLS